MTNAQQRQRRKEQRDQQADDETLQGRARSEAVSHILRQAVGEEMLDDDEHAFAEGNAHDAARDAERDDLQQVDECNLRSAAADALQDGDGFLLLLDEGAGDVENADAAEHENHQARER